MPLFDQILTSDLSAAARVRDIASRFPLMVLDPVREDLAKMLMRRTQDAVSLAQANLAGAVAQGTLEALPAAARQEAGIFAQSLDRVASPLGGQERRWLDDAVDGRCVLVERDAKEFWKSFDAHLGRYGNVTSRSLREAFESLRGGLQASGTDRDVALQDAQSRLAELATEEEGSLSPYVWLALGWLHTHGASNLEQAENAFFKGMLLRNSPSDVVEILLSRHLANSHCLRSSHAAAYAAIQKALAVRDDEDSHLDAARYAALSDRPSEVRRNLDAAFAKTPLACIDAAADPDVFNSGLVVLQAVAAGQEQSRTRLATAWSDQHEAMNRVRHALERSGLKGETAFPRMDEPNSARSGLFESESALYEIGERKAEALAAARRTIEAALKEKRQRVEDAQRQMDDAWNEREVAGSEAQAIHQAHAEAARAKVSEGLPDSARIQQGCMWSLGIGCGGLAIYGVAAALLGTAGVAIGPDTIVGKLAIGLALAPLAFAGFLQLVVASKQSALQAEMWREVERSRLAMEAANQKVDSAYRAKLPKLREELAAAQSELKRLEDALEMLG